MLNIPLQIHIISRFSHCFFARELAPFDIKTAEFPIITYVINNPETSQEKMAETIRLTTSTVTKIVKGLQQKGLIVRLPDEQDKRALKLYATEKSLQLNAIIQKKIQECSQALTDKLSPEELIQFQHFFDLVLLAVIPKIEKTDHLDF